MSRTEVSSKEPCPCDSGKSFGACCKRRKVRWSRDGRGAIHRSVHIGDGGVARLREMEDRFVETFGRKPRGNDPIFFDQFFLSQRELERQSLKAMKAAGIRPELAYAYQQTGRVATKETLKKLTPAEEREYIDSIEEYFELEEEGLVEFYPGDEPDLISDMNDLLKKNQIVSGYFAEKHLNKSRTRRSDADGIEFVVGFSTLNVARSLRAIHLMIENDASYDAFHVVRSIVENVISVAYLYNNPDKISVFDAQIGVMLGTHRFATNKKGQQQPDRILDLSDGSEVQVPTRWGMATSLGQLYVELYNDLYRPISSFCHSDIGVFPHFMEEGRFDFLSPSFHADVLLSTHLLSLLFFEIVRLNSDCPKYLKGDLSLISERSLFAINLALQTAAGPRELRPPKVYQTVVRSVTASNPRLASLGEAIGLQI